MFYAHFVLSKKGPLARIWLAAHWDKKLTKAHVFETNIEGSVEAIIQPKMKLALRTSGHLLLGVVRIYSRKAKYLLADCNEAFVKIKMAFRPGAVDLPEENREAAMAAITLPEDFHEFETSMADLSDIDVHAQFAVNQSRPEEITMREDLGNITLVGDDGFGDMGFDGSSGMIQDANLDDSLYKNTDSASCFLMDGGGGFQGDGTQVDDQPMAVGFDGGPATHHEDGFASGGDDYEGPPGADDDNDSVTDNFGGGEHELFVMDMHMADTPGTIHGGSRAEQLHVTLHSSATSGENFSSEPGGLFEEPPAMMPVVTDSLGPVDPAAAQQKNGLFMSPSRTPRYALSDVTQQQNLAPPVLTNATAGLDHTTLLMDETEAFALEPIDVTAIGSERKVRKKRRLVIDELKSIASETMKLQLSDTSEIVSTLDLAPPTKRLMHWKETGGVEKLFAFPGRQIVSKKLSRLFTSNLVTRSAGAENAADADRSVADVEHTRVGAVAEREMFDPSDMNDMPELAPAMQEAYGMPASVAPCIVDDSAVGPPFDHDMSSRVSFDASNTAAATPRSRPSHASPVHRTPSHMPHASPVKSPGQFIPNLAPYGGSDDENDDAGDYNDDDGDVSSEAPEDITLEPVDESTEPVEEGKEAEAEEQRWNKRSQQMLAALNRCLQRHDSVSFRQMAPPSSAHSRKQAAAKFYTFLVLKKMEAVDVAQDAAYGDIMISRGTKFDLLA